MRGTLQRLSERVDGGGSNRSAVFAVFALALVVRLAFVAVVPGLGVSAVELRGDEVDYHQIAVSLQDGDGFARPWPGAGPDAGEVTPTAFRTPLWPMALAAVYAVFGADPAWGQLLVILLSAAAAALVVPVGRRLWSPTIGLLGGLLAAVFPPMWLGSWRLMSEALFTVLLLVSLLAADRYRRSPTNRHALELGGVLGLAALARPNGLVVAGALTVWIVVLHARRDDVRRAVRSAALCALAIAAVIAPWTIRNAVELDAVVPLSTQGGAVLAGYYSPAVLDRSTPYWGGWDFPLVIEEGLYEATDEVSWDRDLRAQARTWITDNPGDAARIVWYHVLRYFDLYVDLPERRVAFEGLPSPWTSVNALYLPSVWGAFVLGGIGVVRARRAGAIAALTPALLVYAALVASGVLLGAGPRFREPSEPILVLLVAIALAASTSPARQSPPPELVLQRHR